MPIDFDQARWKKIKHDARKWWAGKLGRPLIQVRLKGKNPERDEPAIPFYEFTSFYDLSIPAEKIVDRWNYELCGTKFFGDAFPHVWPNFGPGVIAAFMGARLENGENTAWFFPSESLEIDSLSFKFSEQNPWFNRIQNIIIKSFEKWNGLVQIGMTDLGGNLDILSTFRPSENLLLDLYDHPEQIKRLTWEAHKSWWAYFNEFNVLHQPLNPGYTCWAPIFSEAPYYMLQCDFSYMIGPKMFAEFVLPELIASANQLGNAFYHLDGPGQLPHLDLLLEVASIKGIQWVPGDGAPDVSHWQDVYRRIYQAGKLTQIFHGQYQGDFDLLNILKDQVGNVENICYIIDGDISQEKEIMEMLVKYGVQ